LRRFLGFLLGFLEPDLALALDEVPTVLVLLLDEEVEPVGGEVFEGDADGIRPLLGDGLSVVFFVRGNTSVILASSSRFTIFASEMATFRTEYRLLMSVLDLNLKYQFLLVNLITVRSSIIWIHMRSQIRNPS
jgi:hypothetical protein